MKPAGRERGRRNMSRALPFRRPWYASSKRTRPATAATYGRLKVRSRQAPLPRFAFALNSLLGSVARFVAVCQSKPLRFRACGIPAGVATPKKFVAILQSLASDFVQPGRYCRSARGGEAHLRRRCAKIRSRWLSAEQFGGRWHEGIRRGCVEQVSRATRAQMILGARAEVA